MHIEVLRLSPGDDLRGALEQAWAALSVTHGVQAGCVVSAVGSLHCAVLRFAAEPAGTVVAGPLELLSLAGTFSTSGPHLHASVARADGSVCGGHLLPGCTVRTTPRWCWRCCRAGTSAVRRTRPPALPSWWRGACLWWTCLDRAHRCH